MEKIKSMELGVQAIGGHYSAVLNSRANRFFGNYTFESARSALYALLLATDVKKVFIPNYCCSAVADAILAAGKEIIRYAINENFFVPSNLSLGAEDVLLVVNYFGLCERQVSLALTRYNGKSIIVDCSQAYFQRPFSALATFYSVRKFIPAPDGGILNSEVMVRCEPADDYTSIIRYQALLERIDSEPEPSRQAYISSEATFAKCNIRKMSKLSAALARNVDLGFIRHKRRENFLALDGRFRKINKLNLELLDQVPLCYPLMLPEARRTRQILRENRVFTPHYWDGVAPETDFENLLLNETIFIPVDHRCTLVDIDRIATIILERKYKDSDEYIR